MSNWPYRRISLAQLYHAGRCLVLATCLLSACSESDVADLGEKLTVEQSSVPQAQATATSNDCAKVLGSAVGKPVDDVIGLRPGVSMATAEQFLRCRNPHFKWMRFAETIELGGGRRINAKVVRATSPDEDIYIRFSGAEGQERAVFLSRDVQYRGNDQPTLDDLKSGVFGKYGRFQSSFKHSESLEYGGDSRGTIAYGPDGTMLDRGSTAFWACSSPSNVHSDMHLNAECGLTINYLIRYSTANRNAALWVYDFLVLEEAALAYESQTGKGTRAIEL